jgi:hypothetical protein
VDVSFLIAKDKAAVYQTDIVTVSTLGTLLKNGTERIWVELNTLLAFDTDSLKYFQTQKLKGCYLA